MDIDKHSVVIPSIILSVIGMSCFLILPILIGAAANSLNFDEQELGFMASSIMTGTAISSIFAVIWIRKINWKLAGYTSMLLMLFSHIVALFIHDEILFVLLMCIAAFGGGTLYSIALTVLSDSHHADRYFGFSIAAQVFFQVLGLIILPKFTMQYGINTLLVLFLILETIGLLLLRWLPYKGNKRVSTNNKADVNNVADGILKLKVIFALLGCFMFFFNVGVIWTYIERIGDNVGFSAEDIGLALSIGVFFGIPGALLASWVSERFGYVRPLALAALITLISVYMLIGSISFSNYIIALILYNASWNFSLTFQYSIVNHVDASGKGVAAAPAFHAMGAAVGPAITALYITSDNYSYANFLAITSVIISLLFFVFANRLHRKNDASVTR
jgi:predicted MFS family arabinose efflux permease